tara:strand:+ start:1096 stop:1359 length:264 start_codon:yes stop_codon:yes gene_type:complete
LTTKNRDKDKKKKRNNDKRMHYKALLEVEVNVRRHKRKNERIIYVRSKNGAVGVLDIVRKIPRAKLVHTQQINLQEYITGVSDSKYA